MESKQVPIVMLTSFQHRDAKIGNRTPKKVSRLAGFDFIVAERPKYIRGSGPPLGPITLMPPHDKPGVIDSMLDIYGEKRYLVTYDENPALRVSVRPQNILDWVSQRTYENFETQASRERRRSARIAKQDSPEEEQEQVESRVESPKKGRPAKRKREIEPERNSKLMKVASAPKGKVVFAAPKHVNSTRQRGLADVVVESETEDEEDYDSSSMDAAAIDRQFNGTYSEPGRSKLNQVYTRSESPEPAKIRGNALQSPSPSPPPPRSGSKKGVSLDSRRSSRPNTRSVSKTSSPSDNDIGLNSSQPRRRRRNSVAGTSSREALKVYEDLQQSEIKKKAKAQTITAKYSKLKKKKGKKSERVDPAPVENEDTGNEEYDVKAVLAEDLRPAEGGGYEKWYLLKWEGNYPDSWEPESNLGTGILDKWEKMKESSGAEDAMADDRDMNMDGGADRNGKKSVNGGKSSSRVRFEDLEESDEVSSAGSGSKPAVSKYNGAGAWSPINKNGH